ncbi:sperm-egg fusion protein LLCFC1 isoform X2 [Podarcis raffonei]|uniref:Uncharacterized protein n=1 Tax=Podarcis lilfordi TaxID=74358 RepID=A0AA35LI82_9SAUR|nr:sperm-egg fusion protein LLCFC1 isoform X2 [Podarcis raffonei]CAI5796760.1 Hypothetical predicted protein [Podarcis lilfordi]
MVSLEGTIGLLAVLFTTHFLVYSDGFISQAVLQATMDKRQGGGEGMEVIDMAESEDSQLLGNAAVKDMLLDLAVSLNTASVMLFFLCVT